MRKIIYDLAPSTNSALHHRRDDTPSGSVCHGQSGDIISPKIGTATFAGKQTCSIKAKDAVYGGAVAVASLKGLFKFDMLTPRIFHSILELAEKENTDPFAVSKILAVSARRLQHSFTKRPDAPVPFDVN